MRTLVMLGGVALVALASGSVAAEPPATFVRNGTASPISVSSGPIGCAIKVVPFRNNRNPCEICAPQSVATSGFGVSPSSDAT